MKALRITAPLSVLLTLAVVSQVPAQDIPAPPPPATLWSFLGIPQGVNKVHGALFNKHGNHPGLEKKPPLKALADPANLESKVPAIKKAAEIKIAEDLAKQKIKAVKYLASIGCGCYDVDGGVTEALVAAAGDCTEDVRLATVEAIAGAAGKGSCCKCGSGCCCNKDILKKLAAMAYERDDHGCYLEPSDRVREAASEALEICCPNSSPPVIVSREPVDQQRRETSEGPERETVPAPAEPISQPAPLPAVDGAMLYQPAALSSYTMDAAPMARLEGVVAHVSPQHNLAHIHFGGADARLPVGASLQVFRVADGGRTFVGNVEVVQSFEGSVNVRAKSGRQLQTIAQGYVVTPAQDTPFAARHIAGQFTR